MNEETLQIAVLQWLEIKKKRKLYQPGARAVFER